MIDNMRQRGMKWSDIGMVFGTTPSNIRACWDYAKRKRANNE